MKKILCALVLIVSLAAMAQAQGVPLKQSTATQIQIIASSISTGLALITTGSIPGGFTVALTKQANTGLPSLTTWTPTTFGTGSHDCYMAHASDISWTCELAATDVDTVGRLEFCFHYPSAYDICDRYTVIASADWDGNVAGSYPLASDLTAVKAKTDQLVFTVANKIDSNVYTWNGTAVSAPATAGIPDVNVKNVDNDAASASGTVTFPTDPADQSLLIAEIDTRGTHSVKKNTAFEWGMRFFDTSGNPVTSGTPSCTRGIDSISSFAGTANTASAVTAAGRSEITIAASDINGNYYMWLICTLSGAVDYEMEFKIEAP